MWRKTLKFKFTYGNMADLYIYGTEPSHRHAVSRHMAHGLIASYVNGNAD